MNFNNKAEMQGKNGKGGKSGAANHKNLDLPDQKRMLANSSSKSLKDKGDGGIDRESMTSSDCRKRVVEQWITLQRLHFEKELLMRQDEPVEVDLKALPDYMTMRRNQLAEKKAKKLSYTLDITSSLPKANYKKVKSKLHEQALPTDVEQSLQRQIQFMKDQQQLADTPFISSLKTAQGKNMVKRLKPVLARH